MESYLPLFLVAVALKLISAKAGKRSNAIALWWDVWLPITPFGTRHVKKRIWHRCGKSRTKPNEATDGSSGNNSGFGRAQQTRLWLAALQSKPNRHSNELGQFARPTSKLKKWLDPGGDLGVRINDGQPRFRRPSLLRSPRELPAGCTRPSGRVFARD